MTYLIGTRNGMSAIVTSMRKSPLSLKNTHIITLTFDDDSLPPHLKTQELISYNSLVEGCEIEF
ncbi:hypothetical protein IQ244_31065 [Nostoc sp. LEGE 06077]|nr:hypothetical protein [Nostoc sp. LEGE 06077]